MAKLATLLQKRTLLRLLWLGWALLLLLALGQIARNGRYQPVPGKPGLCLDTRTGQLHFAHAAPNFLEEVSTWSDDPQQAELQRTLTR